MAEQNNTPQKKESATFGFGNLSSVNSSKIINTTKPSAGKGGDAFDKAAEFVGGVAQTLADALPVRETFTWPGIAQPEAFPETSGGRLPASIAAIQQNRGGTRFTKDAQGKPEPLCQKTLKISFFFDGTNNNEEADEKVSGAAPPAAAATNEKPAPRAARIAPYTYPRTTNVARLFHACMGAGGRPDQSNNGDDDEMIKRGWFKHYIQGVGTRFKEVGDLDPGMFGEAFAKFGQARINWGLTRLCDSLGRSGLFQQTKRLETDDAKAMIRNMGSAAGRKTELDQFLATLPKKNTQIHPKGMVLYVVGFSRGAAEARTFVNWLLDYLLERPENAAFKTRLEHDIAAQKEKEKNDDKDKDKTNTGALAATHQQAAASTTTS
ncbi:hypothetical protein FHQ26_04925, partial [Testudinibacter sp. TR-2022]